MEIANGRVDLPLAFCKETVFSRRAFEKTVEIT